MLLRQVDCRKGLGWCDHCLNVDINIFQWLLILPLPLCLSRLEVPSLAQLTSSWAFPQAFWGLLAMICALRTGEIPESSP